MVHCFSLSALRIASRSDCKKAPVFSLHVHSFEGWGSIRRELISYLQELAELQELCQETSVKMDTAILAPVTGPRVLRNFAHSLASLHSATAAMSSASAAADAMASSMETVESFTVPCDEVDRDKEWEKVTDEVEIARATLLHNMEAHSDEVVNSTLTSVATVEVDDGTPLSTRLQEIDQAIWLSS